MKRIITAFLVFCFVFVGCTNGESSVLDSQTDISTEITTDTSLVSETDYKQQSRGLAEKMQAGDFSEIVSLLSEEMKEQISEDQLKTAWNSTIASLGDYIGIYDISQQPKQPSDNMITITVIFEYENNGLSLYLTYDENGRIVGLWLNYRAIQGEPVSNEIFEEIPIIVGGDNYPLDGLLTIPKDTQSYPIVVLIHGSGPNDMDETVGTNKPFRDIARALAEQGIATIRYNKRSNQYPMSEATDISAEVLEDASFAIDLAAQYSDKVFIIGHSLGGMLAPKIALDNPEIMGLISLAGSPRRLEDIIFDQQMAQAQKLYSSQEQLDNVEQTLNSINSSIKSAGENDTALYYGAPAKYWYSLNKIDTPAILSQLDIPMLFLQGADDFQVYADKDFEEWKNLLSQNPNSQFILYENLNHLFMKSNGYTDLNEYNIAGVVDSKVINDIAKWIDDNS